MASANGKHAAVDAFVYLEARHVDALTESVRALTRNVTQLIEVGRQQVRETRIHAEATKAAELATTRLTELLAGASKASDITPGGRVHGASVAVRKAK